MSNILPKSRKKAYAKAMKSFMTTDKIMNIYSSVPYEEKTKSPIIRSLIDPSIKAYPKTPPKSDIKTLASSFLSSSKVSVFPTELIKQALDEFPNVSIDVARNPFLSFSDRFYALRNSSSFFKLLLIGSSTEFSKKDLEFACKGEKTFFPIDIVSNIVFNDESTLEFFYDKDIFSIVASPNITAEMVENIVNSANTRTRKHRVALAELAINPWVSLAQRENIINKILKDKPSKKRAALKIAHSIPYVEEKISLQNFTKFYKKFLNNPMGLYSWAGGSYSIQNLLYSGGGYIVKKNIVEEIIQTGFPSEHLALVKGHPIGFPSVDYVKVHSELSGKAQEFIKDYIENPNFTLVEKIAAGLVFDLPVMSLAKSSNFEHPAFPSQSSYKKSIGVASTIFLRSVIEKTSEWECFASVVESFEGQVYSLIPTIKNL